MVGSRMATAAVGVAGSLLVSALLWWYLDTLAFFLLVPFVPFLFRRSGSETTGASEDPGRRCPACGFRTTSESHEYCPRDGTKLE